MCAHTSECAKCLCACVQAAGLIKNVDYDGRGKVDVEFRSRVEYGKVRVKVTDSQGNKLDVTVTDRDRRDLDFTMSGYREGKYYNLEIRGVKEAGTDVYKTLKGQIYVPVSKGKGPVKDAEYDSKDGEVEFDFYKAVEWNKPKVTISDGNTQYVIKVTDKDARSLEVRVKTLVKGKIYSYKISGIRKRGTSSYTTISGTFQAG